MSYLSADKFSITEDELMAERARLVSLCAWLTGDREAAEDLAQETLIAAWRQRAQLRDPMRESQWLTAIARNLCRRWIRNQSRQRTHLTHVETDDSLDVMTPLETGGNGFDLEVELDRHQLAELLDRALALLPPLTRTVLIDRFIHESPQAEIAEALGLSEGAVEARVQRGKWTMRRLLATELHDDAAAYGLLDAESAWQQTQLWCPCCGQHRLSSYFPSSKQSEICFRCSCGAFFGTEVDSLFESVRGYRSALSRFSKWYHPLFQQGLLDGRVPCVRCGQMARLHFASTPEMPQDFIHLPPAMPGTYGFWTHCTGCQRWSYQSDLSAIAVFVPEVQRFWSAHPRIRILPEQPVEIEGGPGLLVTFQDVTSPSRIELLFARINLTLRNVHISH